MVIQFVKSRCCVALRTKGWHGCRGWELVEREPIQLQIHQGALRAFCL